MNKRGAAAVTIFLISVLVVSSGALVVKEVSNSNNSLKKISPTAKIVDGPTEIVSVDDTGEDVEDSEERNLARKIDSNGDKIKIIRNAIVNKKEISPPLETFVEGDKTFVIRDGEDFVLDSEEIDFEPDLPGSICVDKSNEEVDITVLGKAQMTQWGQVRCLVPGGSYFHIHLKVKEDDFFSNDDLIAEEHLVIHKECSDLDDFYVYYSHTFENVDLGEQFGGVEDWDTIEVYATISPEEQGDEQYTYSASTPNYDVDENEDCECSAGPCCDTSSNEFMPGGSQPIGYDDNYFCEGVSSPSGTNELRWENFYCNGEDASAHSIDSLIEECGLCQFCRLGYSSCSDYAEGTAAGQRECDHLDVPCRNYYDVNRVCDGNGGTSDPGCISYYNYVAGTPCPGGECDGLGECEPTTGCECTGWIDKGCGYFSCGDNERGYTRSCSPQGCDDEFRCEVDSSCEETCECSAWQEGGCATGSCSEYQKKYIRSCEPDGCAEESKCEYHEDCDEGCIDTDGGDNPFVKGNTVDYFKDFDLMDMLNKGQIDYIDHCMEYPGGPSVQQADLLSESFCVDGGRVEKIYNCSIHCFSACSLGECSACMPIHCQTDEDCDQSISNPFCMRYLSSWWVAANETSSTCDNFFPEGGYCLEESEIIYLQNCEDGCFNGECIETPKPDLVVKDFTLHSKDGLEVIYAGTIENQGTLPFFLTSLWWYLENGVPGHSDEYELYSTNIPIGESIRVYMKTTYPRDGVYQAVFRVRTIGVELNYENNEISDTFII